MTESPASPLIQNMNYLKDYRVFNNVVFIIPIAAGVYAREVIFTILSLLILVASTLHHLFLVREHRHTMRTRMLDMTIASLCYLYLFYFVTYHTEISLRYPFYLLLLVTLGVFLLGKRARSEYVHALFHASIAMVAGLIVIF